MSAKSTEYGILSQPHSVGSSDYRIRMIKESSKEVLWASVSQLMTHHYGKENLTRLAREAGIGPGTASRIKAQETSVGMDVVDQIASVFRVAAWQLLTPGFDPASPPSIAQNMWPFPIETLKKVSNLSAEKRALIEGFMLSKIEDGSSQGKRHAA